MWRTVLKSEIRSLTVTGTGPVGSLVLDADLLDAADLVEGERVEVLGAGEPSAGEPGAVDRGAGDRGAGDLGAGVREDAHVRAAERGSGRVELGGRLRPGAAVSLLSYAVLDDARARSWRPRALAAGRANRVAPQEPDLRPAAETDDAAKLDALLQRPED